MIIIFASIVSLVLALLHVVVYKVIVSIFTLSLSWKVAIGVCLAVLGLSFITASVLTFYFDNGFTHVFYTISASWLGYVTYLFLFSCLYALVVLIIRTIGVNQFSIESSSTLFGIICLISAIVMGTYGLVHARVIYIKNITTSLMLSRDLSQSSYVSKFPAIWHDRKAVWVSDIHLGAVHGQSFAKEIVSKINEINPDIVFIGGDLFDGVTVNENEVVKPFADLHPVLGTYFITGNHEEFRDDGPYLQAVKNVGMRVLNDEMVVVDGMQIIGVDDRDSTNPVKFQSILAGLNIDKGEPSILLKHQPSGLDIAAKAGISLQISGHTHRAQIWPLNIFPHLIFKGYEYGLNKYDDMQVYTSSGVGTWGPPMRVGSDSEIVVLEFK